MTRRFTRVERGMSVTTKVPSRHLHQDLLSECVPKPTWGVNGVKWHMSYYLHFTNCVPSTSHVLSKEGTVPRIPPTNYHLYGTDIDEISRDVTRHL